MSEQAVHWSATRSTDVGPRKPTRVWELPGDESRRPTLPIDTQHRVNALLLDEGHDWRWWAGRLRFSPGGGVRPAWLLCEWD